MIELSGKNQTETQIKKKRIIEIKRGEKKATHAMKIVESAFPYHRHSPKSV